MLYLKEKSVLQNSKQKVSRKKKAFSKSLYKQSSFSRQNIEGEREETLQTRVIAGENRNKFTVET